MDLRNKTLHTMRRAQTEMRWGIVEYLSDRNIGFFPYEKQRETVNVFPLATDYTYIWFLEFNAGMLRIEISDIISYKLK